MRSQNKDVVTAGKTALNISLPADDKKFLKVYAAQNGTTISDLIRDYTETLRSGGQGGAAEIHRLEEAYEKAKREELIHTHIAQALARGYTDLFYVNIETDELIEYHTEDRRGVLAE
ncbi:MAG: hypothetical protein IJM42_01250, partial [Synergistes sp.]|nr:hypothetical protein [Synergistes sp.]